MSVEEVFKAAPGCQKVLMAAWKRVVRRARPASWTRSWTRCSDVTVRSIVRRSCARCWSATARWHTNPARKSKRRKLPLKREGNLNLL